MWYVQTVWTEKSGFRPCGPNESGVRPCGPTELIFRRGDQKNLDSDRVDQSSPDSERKNRKTMVCGFEPCEPKNFGKKPFGPFNPV